MMSLNTSSKPSFVDLLKQGGIDKPDNQVFSKVCFRFAEAALLATDSRNVHACVDIYETAKELPSTATVDFIREQLLVSIHNPQLRSGPLLISQPSILQAMDFRAMKNILIKLFRIEGACLQSARRQAAIAAELSACETLANLTVPGLVHCEVVRIDADVTGHGKCAMIKMPFYLASLENRPQFPEGLIANGFYRLLVALREMHNLGLVHMDVKSSNVFVGDHLQWDLGDFGSARRIGEKVFSTTAAFNPCALPPSATVIPAMDMVQLCVMVAVEVDKQTWRRRLVKSEGENGVDTELIRNSFSTIKDEKFRDDVSLLFDGNLKLVAKHIE